MNTFSRIAAIAALATASVGSASATILTLGSYGQVANGQSVPTVSNTALVYTGGTSYSVPTGGVWFGPLANSQWVSSSPQGYPGGTVDPPDGTHIFTTTFMDTTPGTSSGTITVLADDTTSIKFNGVTLVTFANGGPAGHCDLNTPNCLIPTTYTLTGFVNGVNTLEFDVVQQFDHAMGIDFNASVNTAVPEPGSLLLIGTGLLGVSGRLLRRIRA